MQSSKDPLGELQPKLSWLRAQMDRPAGAVKQKDDWLRSDAPLNWGFRYFHLAVVRLSLQPKSGTAYS